MGALFVGELASVADHVRNRASSRSFVGPHVAEVVGSGVSVVLDFPANTVERRQWMRGSLDATEADHGLHVLDVPDAVCLGQPKARIAEWAHPFAPTEAKFATVSKHLALT